MMGIHTHGMIMDIAIGRKLQAALQTPRRLSAVHQHHHQQQVELVRKQQVVVIQHQPQLVVVVIQQAIIPHLVTAIIVPIVLPIRRRLQAVL